MQEHIPLNAAIHTPHANSCAHTQSMENRVHLYAAVAVVGHSDQQALLDDRIPKRQEDLCSYLQQREGDGSSASLVGLCRLPRPCRQIGTSPQRERNIFNRDEKGKKVTVLVLNRCHKGVIVHLDGCWMESLKTCEDG